MRILDMLRDIICRVIIRKTDDSTRLRRLQASFFDGELQDGIEQFEPYGFTSRVHIGAEALMLSLDGDRSHCIAAVVTDRRFRPINLEDGEVCVFDDLGRKVYFKRDGIFVDGVESQITVVTQAPVSVTCTDATITASGSCTIDSPTTHITGQLIVDKLITGKGGLEISGGSGAHVNGDLETTGDVRAAGISLDHHIHGGVQTGSGTTGQPQ